MGDNPRERAGQVDAQNVPRFVGLRTFARLPRLEDVESADAAILGAPVDLGTTFRGGPRFGPAGIREQSLLLKPYNEALDVFPFDSMQVVDAGHIRLRVYERGVGETQACGTGACAAVAVGRNLGLLGVDVQVQLPGGRLDISGVAHQNGTIRFGHDPATSALDVDPGAA